VIEELARPTITEWCLEASYRDMILDEGWEREAEEWTEGLIRIHCPETPMLRVEVWRVNFDPSLGGEIQKVVYSLR